MAGWWQGAYHGQDQGHERGAAKSDPDNPPAAAVAIDLGQDVAKDVTDGEEQRATVKGERPQLQDLAGGDVADQQHSHKEGHDQVKVPVTQPPALGHDLTVLAVGLAGYHAVAEASLRSAEESQSTEDKWSGWQENPRPPIPGRVDRRGPV